MPRPPEPAAPRTGRSGPTPWSPPSGELRDAGLHVRVAGSEPPTIVLLHGLAASHLYYGAAFDALAREARLVVPDLLGFGRSPRPDDVDYGPQSHARALLCALERLQTRAPVYVAAHSAGALIALRLAALRPDWVRGVLAFGPPLYRGPAQARAQLARFGLVARLFAMDALGARLACRWMCRHRAAAARIARWLRPDLPAALAREGVQHSWASYSGTVRNLIVAAQPLAELGEIRAPIWLVAGERDSVVDLAFLRELASRHPHIRLELWPGAHDLPLTAPQRCIDALRALARPGAAPALPPSPP
jgi:pimeloyl-ACP methyl ester carboxylesterase